MNVLITNDDGIESPFLSLLAEAFLQQNHDVLVAVPSGQRSWIGKAMSRHGFVDAAASDQFGCPTHSLNGTPSDCVNIAFSHLCDSKPEIVVSGINIGHNSGLTFVASSGTIGGALEGALHGVPSIAASAFLPPEVFAKLCEANAALEDELICHIRAAASFLEEFARQLVTSHERDPYAVVHSINFPYTDLRNAEVARTSVAATDAGSLFEKKEGGFGFMYRPLNFRKSTALTDRQCLLEGKISHTVLDYKQLGR